MEFICFKVLSFVNPKKSEGKNRSMTVFIADKPTYISSGYFLTGPIYDN
jgi:hypothetical protein